MVRGPNTWPIESGVRGNWVRVLGLGTLVIVLLAIPALLDGDSGIGIWLELREDLADSTARVDELARQNDSLRQEIESLLADPTAMDRVIREELDLALPGEVVVRFIAVE